MVNTYSALHNHSMYSLLDGYSKPEEYLEYANEIGLKAFAITEHGNQYSWCYFDKIKSKYPNLKMIYGVEFYECFDTNIKDKNSKYFHLIALARNEKGRKALNALVTRSNLEGFYSKPRIELNWIKELDCGEDIVVCSACLASKIAREPDFDKCVEYVNEYKSILPYFYLEMQSHKQYDQAVYNKKVLMLSEETNTPYVITTDSHAATNKDLYYQGRHVQIAHDKETMSELYDDCYLQTVSEIHKIMDAQIGRDAVDKGLEETNNIADLIDVVNMPFQEPRLPNFPLPVGFESDYDYLKFLIEQGWKSRGFDKEDKEKQKVRRERIDYELDIIHTMGFDSYFLIVWDFINFAKSQKIAVAPGRGSCAGSLVCFTIGITNLDPIKYGLIFERFLNPERISMPDTDTDVSDRATIIKYLIDKYGEEKVCQIINFSYITPVVAIKDVGKILGFKYNEMDKLSKRFSYDTFEECVENNKTFIEENPQYTELIDIAGHLSGRVKTVSMHAGGVCIVDGEVNDYIGMKLGSDGEHVIQVDKKMVEAIGPVKYDILGVRNLTLIDEVLEDLDLTHWDVDINNPDFEYDMKSYTDVLQKALTNGVFQVESAGMKDLLTRLQPDNLTDLSSILALYRPDGLAQIEDYIARKHDPSKIEYLHPDMEPILKETYGCMIFQEQLMEIVRVFGGRSYGGCDVYRKAIGKKMPELVKSESAKLYQEIIDNGYPEEIAKAISDDLSQKGSYLFNKSHSQSYAVICLQTAYLKAHYPTHFFKALLNLNKSDSGSINKYILDARSFGVNVKPPHINRSQMNFSVYNEDILFGLSAIKGIGEKVAAQILEQRGDGFQSVTEMIEKVSPNKANMIALIKSGAIPSKNKKQTLIKYLSSLYTPTTFREVKTLPTYATLKNRYNIDCEQFRIGENKFDYDKTALLEELNKVKKVEYEIKESERFEKFKEENGKYLENEEFYEFEALQIFIKDNPFDKAYSLLKPFEELEDQENCTLVGVIAKVQKKKDKKKKQFAFVNIYSTFGIIEGIVWHTQLKQYEDLVKAGQQIALYGRKEGEDKVVIEEMRPYNEWLEWIEQKGIKLA